MNCKRPRARVTAAVILTLPLAAAAQTPFPPPDGAPVTKPTQHNGHTSSQGYLSDAARVIEAIPQASLKDDGLKVLRDTSQTFRRAHQYIQQEF